MNIFTCTWEFGWNKHRNIKIYEYKHKDKKMGGGTQSCTTYPYLSFSQNWNFKETFQKKTSLFQTAFLHFIYLGINPFDVMGTSASTSAINSLIPFSSRKQYLSLIQFNCIWLYSFQTIPIWVSSVAYSHGHFTAPDYMFLFMALCWCTLWFM